MFENKKNHISEIISAIFVTKATHPEKKTVFSNDTLLTRYEMIYKISGENYTRFNGKELHVLPGCVYFLPKCDRADYSVERVTHGDCIDIFFDTDTPFYSEAFLINTSANKKVYPLFDKILNVWLGKKEGYYYKCMGIFYEILSEVEKSASAYFPNSKFKLIEPGVDYLHTHFLDKGIKYTGLSDMCGISYSYFKRLFNEKFGVSPIQYTSNLKTQRAKELLSSGMFTVTEVSEMCGFDNVYYFSKVFKNAVGISPGKYKA